MYCSMQILDKLGLGELYEEVERSIEKVVLPSYVQASTASSAASSGAAKKSSETMSSSADKALKKFFASITINNIKTVSLYITCY